MDSLIRIIICLGILSGCGDQDTLTTSSGVDEPMKSTIPAAPEENGSFEDIQWGELTCQRTRSCQNIVLNKDIDVVVGYLDAIYSSESYGEKGWEENIGDNDVGVPFYCGMTMVSSWKESFPEDFSGGSPGQSFQDKTVEDFITAVVDIQRCVLHDDFIERLNTYFLNTEEYRNGNE